jgi:ABC-2 type transport system ATP-binding protein
MTTSAVVRIRSLHKRFGSHVALKGLDLTVPEGSAYALIGANGAGKTTTIKLAVNVIAPTSGTAEVLGVDTRSLDSVAFAQIGYVSENQALPRRMRVGDYLAYLRAFYPAWDRELETSMVRRLQLPLERRIGDLSHGMRIKVALACALPYRPKLLILDEPFSGLDALVRDEFMEDLLMQAGEMTILISSHELAEIEHITTHVGFIDSGRMLLEDSMSDLNARIREVRVTLEGPASLPERLPEEWLDPKAFGNVVSFVDTRYTEADTPSRVRAILGSVRLIEPRALPLRTVFTTLARAARDGALP